MHYVVFCVWFLLFNMMCLHFIHIVAYQSLLPFHDQVIFHSMNDPQFVYASAHLWTLCLLLSFGEGELGGSLAMHLIFQHQLL